MSVMLRKAEAGTSLPDLQDRLQQVEDTGHLLLSLWTKTADDGTGYNVAAFDGEAAAGAAPGKLELFTEPAGMTADREQAFFKTVEADGSSFVTVANLLILGQPARVVVCRRPVGVAPAQPGPVEEDGHGSSNPHPKPPVVTTFRSPNHSSRNGTKIDTVVLHCVEGSRQGAINTFMDSSPGNGQKSAHYVIDRDGTIFQMVDDNLRANHCKGANQNSIGIEHVGSDTDELAPLQKEASVALIRYLLEQYQIDPANVFGHDFTPNRQTVTSCPDRLFGPGHTQETVADWVRDNVVNG